MRRAALSGLAAALIAAPSIVWSQSAEWIALQDGKSLAGWKTAERPESWVVEDGAFVSRGDRSHLFYVGKVAKHDFRNFELSLEVMTSPGANSGVYVHTKWQGPGWPAAGYRTAGHQLEPARRLERRVRRAQDDGQRLCRAQYLGRAGE